MRNQIAALASNYTVANRPSDLGIRYIIIHATQLSYDDTVARFLAPNEVSAHVVIRQTDGLVTEMVASQNVAWHAGNWDLNCRSLGIEQEAYVDSAASFTPVMLNALVAQIKTYAAQYHIPLDRAHILGHDSVPAPSADQAIQMHQDPGRYFDWLRLFKALGQTAYAKQPVQVDQPLVVTCRNATLYKMPSQSGELFTTENEPSWTRTVSYGQSYVCAATQGDWVAIWYDGQLAWFLNPDEQVASQYAVSVHRAQSNEPVYGSTGRNAQSVGKMASGQAYTVVDQLTGIDATDQAGRLKVCENGQPFKQIWFNHRIGFIKVAKK